MNFEDIFNAQNTNGMSQQKLAFLKSMFARQTGNSAGNMMASLLAANRSAAQQGISFTDSERELMLKLYVQTLPPQEAAKAQQMIQMLQRMQAGQKK